MREEGMVAIVVMNHDDYRWLFGAERSQPRAIIPVEGPVDLVAFSGEEPELTAAIGDDLIRVFRSGGGQIHEVVDRLREIAEEYGPVLGADPPRVGMQMWFETGPRAAAAADVLDDAAQLGVDPVDGDEESEVALAQPPGHLGPAGLLVEGFSVLAELSPDRLEGVAAGCGPEGLGQGQGLGSYETAWAWLHG